MHAQDLNEQMYAILADTVCVSTSPNILFCLSIYLSTYPFIYLFIRSYSNLFVMIKSLSIFTYIAWIPILFQILEKNGGFRCKTDCSQTKCRIVRFDNSGSHLWAAPDCEGNFALFSIVHRQALQHQTTKAGSSATTASVVHTEALQS